MLDVCLLGTGGMMPLPGRPLTALMTRFNGSSLLIDCGEGTQVSIREKGWSFHDIDIICVTHFHGDHIAGLPGLLLSMGNADRTKPLVMVGPKGLERVVTALKIIAPELPFEIQYIELSGAKETLTFNDYNIEAFRVNHNVVCYGYSVIIKRAGRFFIEKAKENEVPMKAWSRLQDGVDVEIDGKIYKPEMVLGPERKGIKLTYCTDSRPTPSISEGAQNADLFICEGMYGESDKYEKAVEHKHMTFREAATLAKSAKVSEMWLTHFSPSMAKPELYIENAKEIFANTKLGKTRKSIVLEFDKNE